MLCDHYEIEQITMLIRTVNVNYETESYDDVLIDLAELRLLLKFTSLRYNVLIDNII